MRLVDPDDANRGQSFRGTVTDTERKYVTMRMTEQAEPLDSCVILEDADDDVSYPTGDSIGGMFIVSSSPQITQLN